MLLWTVEDISAAMDSQVPLTLSKALSFTKSGDQIVAKYVLKNEHNQLLDLHFGVEFGLGSYTFPMSESTISVVNGSTIKSEVESELQSVSGLQIESRLYQYKITIATDKIADIWTHPLWTVSLSEGGFEKVYQGAIIMPHWKISLGAGESWQVQISLTCS